MHRHLYGLIYLLALCLASPIDNSTAEGSVNPTTNVSTRRLICPPLPGRPRDDHIVDAALHFHKRSVEGALAAVKQNVSFPPFKAMFKTDQYVGTISTVLEMSLGVGKSPLFICIRTQQEAQHYEARTPGLWQQCGSGMLATWATEMALFICPLFLERGHRPGKPQPKACPGVEENKFHVQSDQPRLFGDRGSEITKYLIVLYNFFKAYPTSPDPNIYMNSALGWDATEAKQRVLSYLMYIQCGFIDFFATVVADRATDNEAVTKNLCKDIPDVTKPPWNFNSLGNDTTSDYNPNPPPSSDPQTSLLQGTLTDIDSIDT